MKNNQEVVLAAVKQNGYALQYASNNSKENMNENQRMAIDLINYFDQNNTGNIVEIDYD